MTDSLRQVICERNLKHLAELFTIHRECYNFLTGLSEKNRAVSTTKGALLRIFPRPESAFFKRFQ
jgi:hypothetical protein